MIAKAKASPGLLGRDLVKEVTCRAAYDWDVARLGIGTGYRRYDAAKLRDAPLIVALDYGIKHNILRRLVATGFRVKVLPAFATAAEILALNPDGVFLSNGPADPAAVPYAYETIRGLLGKKPIFGICLGHQLLGLALGGQTYKLGFGHHGANHPVMDLRTRRVEITSQNHGFAVDAESLLGKAELSHLNLNDKTVEGLRGNGVPFFSVQYHPEASPGPHDAAYLFERFRRLVEAFPRYGAEINGPVLPKKRKDRMPLRKDLKSVLLIGSGPIVIGQGCEFDYSGTQALKALREEGLRLILINSNPATIMTDPGAGRSHLYRADDLRDDRQDHRARATRCRYSRRSAARPRSISRSSWLNQECWHAMASS